MAEGLDSVLDLPHTISYAVMYRERINGFDELPKEKRPPRNLWDKPYKLSQFIDHLWDDDKTKDRGSQSMDFDYEDIE